MCAAADCGVQTKAPLWSVSHCDCAAAADAQSLPLPRGLSTRVQAEFSTPDFKTYQDFVMDHWLLLRNYTFVDQGVQFLAACKVLKEALHQIREIW